MIEFNNGYIEMCKECSQLQNYRVEKGFKYFDKGDYYYDIKKEEIILVPDEMKIPNQDSANYVWLPTLDELNDMISYEQFMMYITAVADHYRKDAKYLCCINENDGKMVLLAMFMQLKYKLMWRQNKWEKIIQD